MRCAASLEPRTISLRCCWASVVRREFASGGASVAEDTRQEIVEVVRDPARQNVQALESLGVFQFVFERAPLGEFGGPDREVAADGS